jgi:hypothetical protein
MIHQVVIAKKAYKVIAGIERLPVGKGVALPTLKGNCHTIVIKVMPQINFKFWNKLLPVLNSIDDQWRFAKVSGNVLTTP